MKRKLGNDENGGYNWDADDYARNSRFQKQLGAELLDKLSLKGHEAVLDIGCGDGKLSSMIAQRLPDGHVIGIDNSPDMIAYAKSSFRNVTNLKFMKIDARKMPFENSFDVVFSNASLHWVKEHDQLLACVKKSLRPGGRILFQMAGRGNVAELIKALLTVVSKNKWSSFFKELQFPYSFYGPEEYSVLIKHAGFEAERIDIFPKEIYFDSREEITGWIRTTWIPYTMSVPEDKRGSFISEIIDEYLKNYPKDNNGGIHIRTLRLEVEALKPI